MFLPTAPITEKVAPNRIFLLFLKQKLVLIDRVAHVRWISVRLRHFDEECLQLERGRAVKIESAVARGIQAAAEFLWMLAEQVG